MSWWLRTVSREMQKYLSEDKDPERLMKICRASSSMPLAAPIAKCRRNPVYGRTALLIPFQSNMHWKKGNDKIVVVLTRNPGYRKKRAVKATEQLYKRAYKKYPNLVRTIMTRNAVYNKQMKLIEKLEEEGKIFVIRPLIPTVSRMEKDYDKLQHFYMHGNRLMKKEYQGLLEYLNE